MIILEHQIAVKITELETELFDKCYLSISNIMSQMTEAKCNELTSTHTGEIITYEDLKRVLGILDGFPLMNVMYNTNE